MKSFKKFIIIWVALVIIALVGEVKCVIKLVKCDFQPSYKAEILYGVGTFTGLGAIFGYVDFGK